MALQTMKQITFALILALGLSACGTYSSVTQVEELAYLQLAGNIDDVVMTLNEGEPQNLDQTTQPFNLNGTQVIKISIPPGQHVVKFERDDELLMLRKFYVSEGNIQEINLP